MRIQANNLLYQTEYGTCDKHLLIPKEEVQEAETNELINKIYDGSADKLFAALLNGKKLSKNQIEKWKKMIKDLD